MASTVNTITGPVDVNELGVTYMHEHLFLLDPQMQHYWPGYQGWDEDEYVNKTRTALTELNTVHGVRTVVDPTVPGLGRNVRAIARASEGTGINLILATGWHLRENLPDLFSIPFDDPDAKAAALQALFMRDFEEGMEGTSIKPGVIKCTTMQAGVTPDIEALLRASARTHLATGLPIITHTDPHNRSGLLQQAIFAEEGVDMDAVVIGHCNQATELSYLLELLDNGTLIGFDQFGFAGPDASLDAQLDNLAELCRRGHSPRIVLSNDRLMFQDLFPSEMLGMAWPDADVERPFGQIHTQVLPGLRDRGVSESQITDMLTEAPRAYFARAENRT